MPENLLGASDDAFPPETLSKYFSNDLHKIPSVSQSHTGSYYMLEYLSVSVFDSNSWRKELCPPYIVCSQQCTDMFIKYF